MESENFERIRATGAWQKIQYTSREHTKNSEKVHKKL